MTTSEELLAATRERVVRENVKAGNDAYLVLKQEMVRLLKTDEPLHIDEPRILTVVLVVGVNGSGKTTSIGKMAAYYKRRGRKVLLGAADPFRPRTAPAIASHFPTRGAAGSRPSSAKRSGNCSCLSHQASDAVSASLWAMPKPSARPASRKAPLVRQVITAASATRSRLYLT